MSVALAVLATATLFVGFGLLHRGGRPRIGCDACAGGACPGDARCPLHSTPEPTHGPR